MKQRFVDMECIIFRQDDDRTYLYDTSLSNVGSGIDAASFVDIVYNI